MGQPGAALRGTAVADAGGGPVPPPGQWSSSPGGSPSSRYDEEGVVARSQNRRNAAERGVGPTKGERTVSLCSSWRTDTAQADVTRCLVGPVLVGDYVCVSLRDVLSGP